MAAGINSILLQALLASIIGGFISLDRTAAFQVMISRPIITGPLIGFVCGSLVIGAVIGVLLELLWIGDLPVGAYIPPHETAAAVIAAAVASGSKGILPERELIGLCILLVIPFAVICQKGDELIRKISSRYYYKALTEIENGTLSGIGKFNLMAVLTILAVNITFFFFFISAGALGIRQIIYVLPEGIKFAFAGAAAIIPLIGIAAVLNTTRYNRGAKAVFLIIFILFVSLIKW